MFAFIAIKFFISNLILHKEILKSTYKCFKGLKVYVLPGCIPGGGWIHSELDDHYNGGPMSLDPQWHIKEPWRH